MPRRSPLPRCSPRGVPARLPGITVRCAARLTPIGYVPSATNGTFAEVALGARRAVGCPGTWGFRRSRTSPSPRVWRRARCREAGRSNRQVDLVVDERHVAIGQHQSHIDLGELREKVPHDRQHVQAAEHDWAPSAPARRAGSSIRRPPCARHSPPRPECACTRRDRLRPLRSATSLRVERTSSARVQVVLEIRHFAADGRQRHAQLAGRGRKLPLSTTATNIDMASSRSRTFSLIREVIPETTGLFRPPPTPIFRACHTDSSISR